MNEETKKAFAAKILDDSLKLQTLSVGHWFDSMLSTDTALKNAMENGVQYRIKPATIYLQAVELPKLKEIFVEQSYDRKLQVSMIFNDNDDKFEWARYLNNASKQ